jgi:hypothetical protein
MLRILARTKSVRQLLFASAPLTGLTTMLKQVTKEYFGYLQDNGATNSVLKEIVEIIEKLSQSSDQLGLLATHDIHQLVCPLLTSNELSVVEAVLLTLLRFTKSDATNGYVTALNVEEPLLRILDGRPLPIVRRGAELLMWLCQDEANRGHIQALRGTQVRCAFFTIDSAVLGLGL